ncbi:hypothetical protein DFH06DRAFT_1151972 [Mycena polygramma]|nr:hypothetical protein DFH06DRAFT_1151972 [Mycena polygramma]
MPPTLAPTPTELGPNELGADCRSTVDIMAQAMQGLPCLRCMLIGLSVLIMIISLARLLSPTRLCAKMAGTLVVTEKLYHGSVIHGIISPSAQLEISNEFSRRSVQRKVSHLEEQRVRTALQPWSTIWHILTGHSFVIACCIWDIEVLKSRIESLMDRYFRRFGIGSF